MHEIGVEGELVSGRDQVLAQLPAVGLDVVAPAVADVPLARRDDLQRFVALLKKVRHAGRGLGLAEHLAAVGQRLDERLPGGESRFPGHGLVGGDAAFGRNPLRRLREDAAVFAEHRTHGQVQFAPPHDVGQVAKGAAHGDSRALISLGRGVGEDGKLDVEDRGRHGCAEEVAVAFVVGVRDEGDAGGKQLRPRGFDDDVAALAVERERVIGAGVFAGLQLRLGDGRLEGHIPQPGSLSLIGLAAFEVPQEPSLGDLLGLRSDRLIVLAPIDREAQVAPERLELRLVLLGQFPAQLDEIAPRDRRLVGVFDRLAVAAVVGGDEIGVVGQRRIAAHAVVVLHAPLGGQAVVIPAHRVEDRLAAHALVARHRVGVRVREDVAHVQGAGHGGRGSVDRVDVLAGRGAVEGVRAVLLPAPSPPVFEALEAGLAGNLHALAKLAPEIGRLEFVCRFRHRLYSSMNG